MKLALITDTHWGVRGDNQVFHDNTKKFLDNIFFPYLEKNEIWTIVHLGDLVDRRKYINIQTAQRLRKDFIEVIHNNGYDYHQILGNHDLYYKNTTSVNSIQELYCADGYSNGNFHLYDKTTEVEFDDVKFLFVPWICQQNKEDTYAKIKSTKAQICLGHLELQGFQMYKGSIATHGEDRKTFDKFDLTCSGHYHHRSTDNSITYLGSHGQFTWSDYNDSRGFHILDTATRELTFLENPYTMFEKVVYNDSNVTLNDIMNINFSKFKDTFCKIIVKNKNNPYWFDMFCEKIEKVGVIDLQVVEDHFNLDLENETEVVSEAESTVDIFKKYVAQINNPGVDVVKLENTLVDLYNRAVNLN